MPPKIRASTSTLSQKKGKGKEDSVEGDTSLLSNPSPVAKSKQKQSDGNKNQPTIDKHLNITHIENPDIPEKLNEILQGFSEKLNMLASQEYIETKFTQMITEELLSKKLKELENDLKLEIQKELEIVRTEVRDLSKKLRTMESVVDTLRNSVSDIEMDIHKLKDENANREKENQSMRELLFDRESQLRSLSEKNNNLEQYTRRNSVRIYGMEDEKSETTEETAKKVIKLLKDKLDFLIQTGEIDIAHRMGKYSDDGNRPVLCKFVRRCVKIEVMRARRKLKGTAVVIREDLTHENAKLLENTSAHKNVKLAWSDEGKIVALLKNNKKILVDRKTNIDNIPVNVVDSSANVEGL